MVRQINWSGYLWNVYTDGWGSWGGNHFSDSTNNVWIDANNNLHLKITNVGGIWYCAEVETANTVGPGTFITNLVTNPLNPPLDKYTVMGIFYYKGSQDEIDIEYARWGDPNNNNLGMFTVFTDQKSDTGPHFYINEPNTVNKIAWPSNGKIFWETKDSSNALISSRQYTGPWVTSPGGKFHFNLWLHTTNPPSDGLEKEMVLSSFTYIPEGTNLVASLSTNPNTISTGQSVTFIANVTGGTPPYSYSWQDLPSGCTGTNSNSITCNPNTPGTYNVTVNVTDSANNIRPASGTLVVNAPSSLAASLNISHTTITVGQSVSFTATATGGTSPYNYTWTGLPAPCTGNTNIITCTPSSTGTFNVLVTVKDSNNNTATASGTLVIGSIIPTIELVQNPRFEIGKIGMPDAWKTYKSGTTPSNPFIYPVTPGRDGKGKCVSINFPTKYSGDAAWIQNIKITAGKSYIFSAYMKTNNVVPSSGYGARLMVDWFNGSTWMTYANIKTVAGTTDWAQYSGVVIAPANATNANVVLRLQKTSGQVWFDDVSFKLKN